MNFSNAFLDRAVYGANSLTRQIVKEGTTAPHNLIRHNPDTTPDAVVAENAETTEPVIESTDLTL